MKSDILFVTEKWCDGVPQGGLTNNYHNLFGTFKNTNPDKKIRILHLDEVAFVLKTHIDNVIPKVVEKEQPKIVIFSLLGKSNLNPTIKTYEYLKNKNIKMIFMWPDIGLDWGRPEITSYLKKYADLHICWGSENNLDIKEKILWLWCPQDETLYKPSASKEIEVSFIGSTRYEERARYLKYLLDNKINVKIDGGQREAKLTPEKYADLISKTKINLNFPYCPSGFDQCKGRVWEILATKGFLLERKNKATERMLTPGKDYVEYLNEADLINKIKYYLEHEEERKKIEEQGYKTYKEKYSAKIFWETVFKEIENG
jgi:hypothetical protein